MNTSRTRSRTSILAPAMALCVLASVAFAQPANKKKVEEPPLPPTITKDREGSSPVIPYILAFLTIGLVVGVTTIPSRRGHQD